MLIREQLEEREKEILAPWAAFSVNSKGREREEAQDDLRPVFQRDRDRILHSKSFRRLKDKTQVFIMPDGDHYRTRMTHTLEVSQNARTIAKALRLNEDLTEAIALGHDLGHTPFGHAGERVLNRLCSEGFNLHHDMDDAIRGGILTEADVPEEIASVLGHTKEERLDTFVHDIIATSMGRPVVEMSPAVAKAFSDFRKFLFESVYTNPKAKGEEKKAMGVVETLYQHYLANIDELPPYLQKRREMGDSNERVVCDYISSMTDRFAIARYEDIYIPRCWQ